MLAPLQGFGKPQRCIAAGRNQRSHVYLAYPADGRIGGRAVGSAIEDRCIEAVRNRGDRRQFLVGEVRRKDQGGLAVEPELMEQRHVAGWDFDAVPFGVVLVEIPDVIEVGELGGNPAEIIPNA